MVFIVAAVIILALVGRLVYLMVFDAEYYQKKAEDLHERERDIKAARGEILDARGTVLATNKTVCTISVIHSQIREPELRPLPRLLRWMRRLCVSGWKRCRPWRGLRLTWIRRLEITSATWNWTV